MPASAERIFVLARFAALLALVGLSLTGLFQPGISSGQETPTKPAPPQGNTELLAEGSVKPDAYYFYDKETGNKIMVPGVDFQALQELIDFKSGRRPRIDPYSFEQAKVSIKVQPPAANAQTASQALIDVEFSIRLDPSPEDSISVPLWLPNIYLVEPLSVEGIDQFHLDQASLPPQSSAEKSYVGYALRVQPKEKATVTVRGKFRAQVKSQAGLDTLELQLPETSTQISLQLPQTELEVDVVGRGEAIRSNEVKKGGSEIEIDSNGGPFTIRWQRKAEQAGPSQVLDVAGDWEVNWPSQADRLQISVNLLVENLRGSVGSFEITIPEPAVVSTETLLINPKLQINPLTGSGQTRWQVTPLPGESPPRLELRLKLEVPGANITSSRPFQLPAIDVVGALRQWGQVRVEVQRPERLRWAPGPSVRPMVAETAASNGDARVYAFEYGRMPIALSLWTDNPQEQMRLTPRMTLNVGPEAAEMSFSLRGTMTAIAGQPIEIDLRQWNLLSVEGAAGPLAADAYRVNQHTVMIEPDAVLPKGFGAGSPPLQLLIQAGLPLENETIATEIPLLKVGATENSSALIEPTELEIRPASGWLFVPDIDASIGLERISTSLGDSVVLRTRPSKTPPRLKGYLLSHQQEVQLDRYLKLTASAKFVELEERMHFHSVRDLPALELKIPTGERLSNWEVLLDGGRVAIDESGENVRVIPTVPLLSGEHNLVLRRTFEIAASPEGTVTALPIIDFANAEGQSSTEVPLEVATADGIRLEVANGAVGFTSAADSVVTIPASGLSIRSSLVSPTIINHRIDRMWLQTIHGGTSLRERAVLRLERPPRKLRLPADMIPVQATILADIGDQPVAVTRTSDQQLELLLPTDQEALSVSLTIWISGLKEQKAIRSVRPLLERWGEGVEQVYWQLVVPQNEHALWLPEGAASGMAWHWEDWRFLRIPRLDDEKLALWSGVQPELNRPLGNRYLSRAFGGSRLQARVVERSLLWTVVASGVLGAAAMFIYLPLARHPLTIVLFSLCLAGAGILWPDAALICAQLAIGASLFVVAMLILRRMMLHQPHRSALGPAPLIRQEGSTRKPTLPVPALREPSSTRGAELTFQPAGESRP